MAKAAAKVAAAAAGGDMGLGASRRGPRPAARTLWALSVLGLALPLTAEASLVDALAASSEVLDRSLARAAGRAAAAAVASGRGWATFKSVDEAGVATVAGPAGLEAVRLGRLRLAAVHAHNGGGGQQHLYQQQQQGEAATVVG